jgi:hypothetical protein
MKAFVETSVLTDALLKPGVRSSAAISAINGFDESLLPVYAIKEFKAGPLRKFCWFHAKLSTTKSFSRSVEQLRRMASTPQRYFTSTALEALELLRETIAAQPQKNANPDLVLCDRWNSLNSLTRTLNT